MATEGQVEVVLRHLAELQACPQCGTRIRFADAECPHCGVDIEEHLRAWARGLLRALSL